MVLHRAWEFATGFPFCGMGQNAVLDESVGSSTRRTIHFFEIGARRRSSSKKLEMKVTLSYFVSVLESDSFRMAKRWPSGWMSKLRLAPTSRIGPSNHNCGFSTLNMSL